MMNGHRAAIARSREKRTKEQGVSPCVRYEGCQKKSRGNIECKKGKADCYQVQTVVRK